MAYRFKAKEPVPAGIRRIVGEEIDSARALLAREAGSGKDEAVHEARKSVKKVRGVLRLVRPVLRPTYRAENKHFRSVGHQLSELRDAAALLEIFDQLAKKYSGILNEKIAAEIRRGLEQEKGDIEQRLDVGKVVERATGALESAHSRLQNWPLKDDGFAALAPGLKQTYRRGRRALKTARKKQDAISYHDFRKRVKDHWYHVRLLEGIWTEVMRARETSLKELETWLGDDHNLAVLREKLEANPHHFGGAKNVDACLTVVAQFQRELREQAKALGERLYEEKPGGFARGVGHLWKTWQKDSDAISATAPEQPQQPAKKLPARAGKKIKETAA